MIVTFAVTAAAAAIVVVVAVVVAERHWLLWLWFVLVPGSSAKQKVTLERTERGELQLALPDSAYIEHCCNENLMRQN